MRSDCIALPPPRGQRRRRSREARLFVLDSDGTVFDSMRPKHEGAFLPAFISWFAPLDPGAGAEVWTFVNLASRRRGSGRFFALGQALRLLPGHPLVLKPDPAWARLASSLSAWLDLESHPGPQTLAVAAARDPLLAKVLAWSLSVDEAIRALPPPRPFAAALEVLPLLQGLGEVLVLSSAPQASLEREWQAAGILGYASSLQGQESGSKTACLAARAKSREGRGSILCLGDSPVDLEAARSTGGAFYPIIPGREDESWRSFKNEGLPLILGGSPCPAGSLLADFLAGLPLNPSWRTR